MTGPLGQLPEHQLFEILQEKLNSNPCRNQGFVLDGFPNTYDQAKSIFSGKIIFCHHPYVIYVANIDKDVMFVSFR